MSAKSRDDVSPQDASSVVTEPSTKRRRVALACDTCRERKTKCDGSKPVCKACQRRGYVPGQCVYAVISDSARMRSEQSYRESLRHHTQVGHASESSPTQQPPNFAPTGSISYSTTGETLDTLEGVISRENPLTRSQTFNLDQSQTAQVNRQLLDDLSRTSKKIGTAVHTASDHYGQDNQLYRTQTGVSYDSATTSIDTGQGNSSKIDAFQTFTGSGTHVSGVTVQSPVSAMGTSLSAAEQYTADTDQVYGSSSVVYLLSHFRDSSNRRRRDVASKLPPQVSHVHPRSSDHESDSITMLHARYSLPPRSVADKLIKSYFDHIHVFYPWVHTQSIYHAYRQLWSGRSSDSTGPVLPDIGLGGCKSSSTAFFTALNSIFLLGCEHSNLTMSEKGTVSAVIRGRLEDLLQTDLLGSGDLCNVQALLIYALYLQCTNSPSRCWNVVGLAYRMALGLGLHLQSAYHNRSQIEIEMRRRIWHACTQLDTMSCMTLGRPPITFLRHHVPLPAAIDDQYLSIDGTIGVQPAEVVSQTQFTLENIKLSHILEQILLDCYVSTDSPLYSSQATNIDVLLSLDSKLSTFARNLPDFLHWDKLALWAPKILPVFRRQSNVLHARYLHLRILLYRPIFSDYCAKATRTAASQDQSGNWAGQAYTLPFDNNLQTALQARCAVNCIEAVCELVDSLADALSQSATGAWWWSIFYIVTSAVILLVADHNSKLVGEVGSERLEGTWGRCFAILQQIAQEHAAVHPYIQVVDNLRQRTLRHAQSDSTRSTRSQEDINPSDNRPKADEDLPVDTALHETQYLVEGEHVSDFEITGIDLQAEATEDWFLQEWQNGWEDIILPSQFIPEFDFDSGFQ